MSGSPDGAGVPGSAAAPDTFFGTFDDGSWRHELDRLASLELGDLSIAEAAERYARQTVALDEDDDVATEADYDPAPVDAPAPGSADTLLAAGLPPEHVAALAALASAVRPTLEDLDRTLDAIAEVQARVDA